MVSNKPTVTLLPMFIINHISKHSLNCLRFEIRNDGRFSTKMKGSFGVASDWPHLNLLPGGELPDIGYTGMCHRPGLIFHHQKSKTSPKFFKFYSRTGPTF